MTAISPIPRQFIHFHPKDGRSDLSYPRCRLNADAPVLLLSLQQIIEELEKVATIAEFLVGVDVSASRRLAGYAKDLVEKHLPGTTYEELSGGNGTARNRG